ncbi:hypothetical protein DdX_13252 [Ditylenchus destructor]|uniref:Uncharacterized protein n=1 Tax=Ditylenchus destructor TaxID=166010 RepID=A0AAD4MX18_9BILA|nr:hypothetical protein DdX_13252 [Ditylenchus destructor]
MFSSIVYSVLLAFALSDIGGGGLAVADQMPEERDGDRLNCGIKIRACKTEASPGSTICESLKNQAVCVKKLMDNECKCPKCPQAAQDEYEDNPFQVPADQCACCGEAREVIRGLQTTLKMDNGKDECPAPPKDTCVRCKVNNGTLNGCFKDKDTCENLLEAIGCAKTQIQGGEAKCSEGDLKNYIKAQKFVIKDAAECHTDKCNDLEQTLANYTLTVMVQSNGNVTECPVGDAAFRIGSALAPVLGALGIVLITFKIL